MRTLLTHGTLALAAGLAACEPAPPPTAMYPISVVVLDERGLPLPGAAVSIDDTPAGTTGPSGRIELLLRGVPETTRTVQVTPPPAYRIRGEARASIELRRGDSATAPGETLAPLPVEVVFAADDQHCEVLLLVTADCPPATPARARTAHRRDARPSRAQGGCEAVEVIVDEQSVGQLDAEGRAFVPLWVIRNQPLTVRLVAPGRDDLAIEAPVARFTPTAHGQILLMPRALTEAPPSPRPPVGRALSTGRIAPPPQAGHLWDSLPPPVEHPVEQTAPVTTSVTPSPATPARRTPLTVPSEVKCSQRASEGRGLDDTCRAAMSEVQPDDLAAYIKARKLLLDDARRGGKWKAVLAHAEALLATGSLANDPELHFHRGQALVKLTRYDDACEALDRALQGAQAWPNARRGERTLAAYEALAFAWTRRARSGGRYAVEARRKAIDHWERLALIADDLGRPDKAKYARSEKTKLEAI